MNLWLYIWLLSDAVKSSRITFFDSSVERKKAVDVDQDCVVIPMLACLLPYCASFLFFLDGFYFLDCGSVRIWSSFEFLNSVVPWDLEKIYLGV